MAAEVGVGQMNKARRLEKVSMKDNKENANPLMNQCCGLRTDVRRKWKFNHQQIDFSSLPNENHRIAKSK